MNESNKGFPSNEELDAEIAEAYAELLEALSKYTAKVRRRGWSGGWDVGYPSGRKSVLDALDNRLTETPAPRAPVPPVDANITRLSNLVGIAGITAADSVLNFITKFPGKRGVEIAQALSNALPERTVRTALHRLKNKKIKVVNGGWYTIEAAPADSSSTSSTEEE